MVQNLLTTQYNIRINKHLNDTFAISKKNKHKNITFAFYKITSQELNDTSSTDYLYIISISNTSRIRTLHSGKNI